MMPRRGREPIGNGSYTTKMIASARSGESMPRFFIDAFDSTTDAPRESVVIRGVDNCTNAMCGMCNRNRPNPVDGSGFTNSRTASHPSSRFNRGRIATSE